MTRLFLALLICVVVSCKKVDRNLQSFKTMAQNAAVASGKTQATKVGLTILHQGGNAADAAVATAFALSVVEPSMSGLGGRMQAIIRLEDGLIEGLDATTEVPAAYDTNIVSKEIYGYHVIGVPGVVAGLCKLNEDYGELDLATVMEPAISLAENGFPLSDVEAEMHHVVLDQMREFEGTKTHFLKNDGNPYQAGDLFIQPDLAQTLRLIARKGPEVFYKGEIAEKMVADNQRNGGVLAKEDLANYRVRVSKIVRGSYKGFDLYGLWLPSFGAITIEIMHILEELESEMEDESEWIQTIYQAMVLGYRDRSEQFLGDTAADFLTSKEYARDLANEPFEMFSTSGFSEDSLAIDLEDQGHTTNLVSSDQNGMMVVLTQSLGPIMGSKVATPGLGFMHATASGKYLMAFEPGMRTSSHISPMIVEKNKRPFLGIGAAGGSRIVTAIANVLSRVIDHGMELSEAILAPRVFPNPDSIHLEIGTRKSWENEIIQELLNQSIPVSTKADPTKFGIIHAIMYDTSTRQWIPAAEPDWNGSASSLVK